MSRSAYPRLGTARFIVVALALSGFGSLGSIGCGAIEPNPNVLLIVIDTVRADRLSSYGYGRPTTPHIDALARGGIRYANASSTSSWTLPAHASLFTGVMPIRHKATQEHRLLDDDFATLAELFSAAGHATFGVSGNPLVSKTTGLARGFENFALTRNAPFPNPPNRHTNPVKSHPNIAALRSFWSERDRDQPFLAFVNFIEAHGPYEPPEPWRSRFLARGQDVRLASHLNSGGVGAYYGETRPVADSALAVLSDLYDGEVAYVDALVGELLAELERAGLADDTIVVLTSDHGENLGDHGHFRHVFSLYKSTVRIPLIIRLPGGERAGEVRPEAVSLVELFPTLLAAARIEAPDDQAAGRDLLAGGALLQEPVFAEYYYPAQVLESMPDDADPGRERLKRFLRRLRSVEVSGLRMIWSSSGEHELYDVEADPGELHDLARRPEEATHRRELEGLIDAYIVAGGRDAPIPPLSPSAPEADSAFGVLDDEQRRELRQLGYVR